MDRLTALAAERDRAKTGTQEYLDAMPTERLSFRPAPEARSFAEQFLHVAATQYNFAAAATGQASPLPTAGPDPVVDEGVKGDKDALRRFVLDSYDFAIAGVRALATRGAPAVLDEEVEFFGMRIPRAPLLAKAREHHAHHRGQAAM